MNYLQFALARNRLPVWLAMALLMAVLFQDTFKLLYVTWQREEYSHGFLVPLISALLLWQRRERLEALRLHGSWLGVALLLAGLAIFFLGSLASITTIDAYALVIVIAGLALAALGRKAFLLALAPLALLLLMNPLPAFLYNNLSSELQLVSSQLGVAVIRLFGISVHLEGNVIDLGSYQLQVVEACSGLRYLFPLLTLGVIVSCFLHCATWIRWIVVLSTVPITVLMNSFRIGVIGVLVDRFGIAQAEGFLHDFEGWIIFMACFALLIVETWMLVRLSGDRRSWRSIFYIEFPTARPLRTEAAHRPLPSPALAALGLLLVALVPAISLSERAEVQPARAHLLEFPLQLGDWQGRRDRIDAQFLDVLQLDDYLLADYSSSGKAPVNFYVAYYASQRGGQSAHSPSSCLPGSGWRIQEFGQRELQLNPNGGGALRVNRAFIQQGATRQLVYYWFKQRERLLTSELAVKWFLFWDALTRNRTDGALIRTVTVLRQGESVDRADERMTAFLRAAAQRLPSHLPD